MERAPGVGWLRLLSATSVVQNDDRAQEWNITRDAFVKSPERRKRVFSRGVGDERVLRKTAERGGRTSGRAVLRRGWGRNLFSTAYKRSSRSDKGIRL
ncbi:hypothetical protein RB213_003408 [Colletotrichum asianum]